MPNLLPLPMAKANAQQAIKHAQQLIQQGQFRSASKITQQLANAFPNHHQILLMHAQTLERRGRYAQAIVCMNNALNNLPKDATQIPTIIISIAKSHAIVGDLSSAIETLTSPIAQGFKDNQPIAASLIDRYLDQDDHESARAILHSFNIESTLINSTTPQLALAWARFQRSTVQRSKLETQEIIDQLQTIVQRTDQPYTLELELGRLYERASMFDQAFESYQRANQSNPPIYRKDHTDARLAQIKSSFTPSTLSSIDRPSPNPDLPKPILIVGMPRSGTSIVEQIISVHPDIQPAGESQAIPELVSKLTSSTSTTQSTLSDLRAQYLDELQGSSNQSPKFITDKNPMNLFLLGHALSFIPDAIIIRVIRDPRDICLSCYSSPLASDHTYKFDLEHCAHFASTAHHTLNHFQSIIETDNRATWINISYEQLTQNPQEQINALFAQIPLEPHPDCFAFHTSKRAVQTISRDQVRQPMNTNSLARFKNFEHIDQLQSMTRILNEHGLIE